MILLETRVINQDCFHRPMLSDLLAVPDFLMGAMENWGLVLFRRVHLVYDDRFSSTDTKLSLTKVIAHELAHQVILFSIC